MKFLCECMIGIVSILITGLRGECDRRLLANIVKLNFAIQLLKVFFVSNNEELIMLAA